MSFSIITIDSFDRELKNLNKKYPSLKQEYADLLDDLEKTPRLGTSIGKNCYKIRLSIRSKGKGKSGGARVIPHLIVNIENEILYLLKIYDKADHDNISETEPKQLLSGIERA